MEQKSGTPVNLELTRASLAPRIDHTFLKPYGTPADIERLCREAKECGFAMVAVTPAEVERCVELLKGSTVRVGAAIGFPLGQNTVETKTFEIHDAISKGATEIDMVINVRALQAGNEVVIAQEIREMVGLCAPNSIISKVILETCYLTDEQKQCVCQIAVDEGADFVKTSTGFGSGGATIHDVALMYSAVRDRAQVKASGGIRTLQQVLDLMTAGATRIGTSNGVAILNELEL